MKRLAYSPSEAEIMKLASLLQSEGWAIFEQIMVEKVSQIGLRAIQDMDTEGAKPPGYWKGYLDSIQETVGDIEVMVEGLRAERAEANMIERAGPARGDVSSGDTAS